MYSLIKVSANTISKAPSFKINVMAKKYFELLNIDDSAESTLEAFGISEEREEILEKEFVYEIHASKRRKISQNLSHLVRQCESLEEVAYVCFMFGKQMGKFQAPMLLFEGLKDAMEEAKRRAEEDDPEK